MPNTLADDVKRLEVELNATNERLNRLIDATDTSAVEAAPFVPPVNPGATASPAADVVLNTTTVPVTEAPVTPAA